MTTLGIIGGTGLDEWGEEEDKLSLDTPYGDPSADLHVYRHGQLRILFIPRHGEQHQLPPHCVNYRANCWAMREAGVDHLLAVHAVGGLEDHLEPGSLLLPDQILDFTWGREHTYSDSAEVPLQHVDFDSPYAGRLRELLLKAAVDTDISLQDGGVHAIAQGPRFETAAEVAAMKNMGCAVVGMTGMPEAALAAELGINYASLCVIANKAAGLSDIVVTHEYVVEMLKTGMTGARRLVTGLLDRLEKAS